MGRLFPSPSASAPAKAPPQALSLEASLPPARCPSHMQSVTAGEGGRALPYRPRTAVTASSSSTPAFCAYPACTSRPRAISELQPRGQSDRKKQEVWDSPSRGAGSPKRQGSALGAASPSRPPQADFPGVHFGGWPEFQKSRCVWGSFKAHSQGSLCRSICGLSGFRGEREVLLLSDAVVGPKGSSSSARGEGEILDGGRGLEISLPGPSLGR